MGDRKEGQERGNICISIADSFDIQQKLTQYCNAITSNKKIKNKIAASILGGKIENYMLISILNNFVFKEKG